MNNNNKFLKHLNNIEAYICSVLIAAMAIIVFIQVVFRFVIEKPLPWSEEVSRYLMVWITFIGASMGVKEGAHIGVEAFTLLLPESGRKVAAVLSAVICIIFCAVVLKQGITIVAKQLQTNQLSPACRIPMAYMYAAIPTGMVMMIIRFVQQIYYIVTNKKMNTEEEVLV